MHERPSSDDRGPLGTRCHTAAVSGRCAGGGSTPHGPDEPCRERSPSVTQESQTRGSGLVCRLTPGMRGRRHLPRLACWPSTPHPAAWPPGRWQCRRHALAAAPSSGGTASAAARRCVKRQRAQASMAQPSASASSRSGSMPPPHPPHCVITTHRHGHPRALKAAHGSQAAQGTSINKRCTDSGICFARAMRTP